MPTPTVGIRGVVPLLLVLALGGCGSGSSSSSDASSVSTTVTAGAGAPTHGAHASGEPIATVNGSPIAKSAFEHWRAVTAALSNANGHSSTSASNQAVKNQALGFLISLQWVLDEASARGVNVSEAAVHTRLAEIQRKQFKSPGELQKYLTKAHETETDLQLRVKLELLEQAISQQVTAAKHTAAEKRAALSSFQTAFQKKWKAKTSCHSGYVVEDCSEF